jgi:hypothetical protein
MSKITHSQFKNTYNQVHSIGNGSFGEILKIIHLQSKKFFALKKLKITKISQRMEAMKEI